MNIYVHKKKKDKRKNKKQIFYVIHIPICQKSFKNIAKNITLFIRFFLITNFDIHSKNFVFKKFVSYIDIVIILS